MIIAALFVYVVRLSLRRICSQIHNTIKTLKTNTRTRPKLKEIHAEIKVKKYLFYLVYYWCKAKRL